MKWAARRTGVCGRRNQLMMVMSIIVRALRRHPGSQALTMHVLLQASIRPRLALDLLARDGMGFAVKIQRHHHRGDGEEGEQALRAEQRALRLHRRMAAADCGAVVASTLPVVIIALTHLNVHGYINRACKLPATVDGVSSFSLTHLGGQGSAPSHRSHARHIIVEARHSRRASDSIVVAVGAVGNGLFSAPRAGDYLLSCRYL